MQHVYSYSKWDSIHEPYNIVENVLKDDDTYYKGLQPCFDFILTNKDLAFIAEVMIWAGDVGPN